MSPETLVTIALFLALNVAFVAVLLRIIGG